MATNRCWAVVLVACLAMGCASPQPDEAQVAMEQSSVVRVAFGSCALQWEPQPIWDAILEEDPDLFLFLGDAIYADWDGERVREVTVESLRQEWARLDAVPGFRRLRDEVPVMATWDNHDYGKHDGGAEFALKAESQEIFLDFFGEPADSERRRTPGVYTSAMFGPPGRRVQVILIDNRYFKSPCIVDDRPVEERPEAAKAGKYLPNPDPDATLLGEAQWRWLEAVLREPAELRLLCSGTQVVPDQKGQAEWGNFPRERQRLFDLIRDTGANGVVILSGNVHFAELSLYGRGSYPLYDLTSSGMTHLDPEYAAAPNPYRVAGPLVELNFGLVEVEWPIEGDATVHLRGMSADGAAFERTVPLDSLSPD